MGGTLYIGLNIYTEAIQNCTARAPGAAEAACGCRPAGPDLLLREGRGGCQEPSPGPGTRVEAGDAEEVPAPLSGPVREAAGMRELGAWEAEGPGRCCSIVHVDFFVFLVL